MAVTTEGNKKILSHTAEVVDSAITEANKIPTIESTLLNKVDIIEGKGLSTNDFTDEKSNQIDTNKTNILSLQTDKQDKLIAGTNIVISEDGKTISASGDIEETVLSNAIGDYLTANPPNAMTDEAIATSVNNSIASGAIEVMSEVEDGSIGLNKLNKNVLGNAYRFNRTSTYAGATYKCNNGEKITINENITVSFGIKKLTNMGNITVKIDCYDSSMNFSSIPSSIPVGEYYSYTSTVTDKIGEFSLKPSGLIIQLLTSSVVTFNCEIHDLKITVDGVDITNKFLNPTSEDTEVIDLIPSNFSLATKESLEEKNKENKVYVDDKLENISDNLVDNSILPTKVANCFPLDNNTGNTYIKNLIKDIKIFSEYKTSINSKTTDFTEKVTHPTYWFDTLECIKSNGTRNIKIKIKNDNNELFSFSYGVGHLGSITYKNPTFYDKLGRLRAVIQINDWNNFHETKFLSEFQILEGTGNITNALIDSKCIIPTYPNIRENLDLSLPDRLYTVAGENEKYALPMYVDYVYGNMNTWKDTKDNILFEGGSDVTYFATPSNNYSKNLSVTPKTLQFESRKYNVEDAKVKIISTKASDKIENSMKILIIGDSVTAGAITRQQYWSACADFFAKEDLFYNRDSKVMFLGTNNYRTTNVTVAESSKDVFACACGISSWSLNSWLTTDNDGAVNGFTYTENDEVKFSFLKWLERYRNYDDEGNKLSIGDSNLGTLVTEDNINKIQCCTPDILIINSTHNGGSIEEHLKIAEIAKREIPNIKIIFTDPMPLLGTWNLYKYVNKDWVIDGLEEPNYRGQMGKIEGCITKSKYWKAYEQCNEDVYVFPITWLTPTVEGWECDEFTVPGLKKTIKRTTTQALPKEHPGTATHAIWGYELYSLLKYIGLKDKANLTTSEETITLDNTTLTITLGSTATLTATSNNSKSELTYYSSDESIATVDKTTGEITPVASGECKVYVNGNYLIKPVYCTVTVTE